MQHNNNSGGSKLTTMHRALMKCSKRGHEVIDFHIVMRSIADFDISCMLDNSFLVVVILIFIDDILIFFILLTALLNFLRCGHAFLDFHVVFVLD